MVLFSLQLLLLLTVASSTRVTVEEIEHKAITQHFASEASEALPQLGEKCYEHTTAKAAKVRVKSHWHKRKRDQEFKRSKKFCADGLVCSKTTWTCKVAIMQPCNTSWSQAVGVSQCAGTGTYGRTTTCGKTDPHGQSFCCIKGMLPLVSLDHQLGRRALYIPQYARAGRPVHLPECCSGLGEYVVANDLLLIPEVQTAWMCK
eukprot:s278_g23.t1